MSNVINIGWEPLQLMMRDINSSNVPEEFKHLPFTDEVNQLLLSALSSGENNYYGNDSTYYRSRYGSSDQNSPCPPSNMYSNNSTSLSPPQPGQLSPPQQQAKAPKIQPPSIQLPNSQHPNAQLSPRLLHQNQLLPQLQPQLQNIPQNKISQPQQTQMQQRYQQQVPTKNQPQQQQMQMPQLPPQLQQMQQMQQQQQQNTISSLDPPRATALQAHLLQQLQQQRQAQQQNSQQVKQQPSPPQQSRPSSPTQVSLQRPPSPPDMVQQPQQQQQQQQQRMSPTRQLLPAHLINQQLPTGYSSHLPVLPQFQSQMLPSHLNNPMLNQSHLMNMQQLQQYQLQATQQIPVPSSSLQPAQSSQSQPQQQPQQQQSPQLQTTQQTMKPTTTVAPAPSQAPAQQSQFMRTVSQPPSSSSSPSSIPMEPLSPTVYQFINVKDEQQDNKSKPLTEKQKNRRRASQNLASRNYRQRKKEYITTMEDRAQDLEHQNELLRRQMNQKEVIISKLSKENSTLRANANLNEEKYSHDVDIEDAYSPIDSNMQDLILKLERTLKLEKVDTDDEAESAGLKSTLQAFYGSLHERHDRYTNQVKEIVNPCTQAKLSALYADPTSPFDNGFTENDDDWWEAFSEDADIADEQADKIQEIRRGHHIEFQRLRTERRDLNKDIRDYYKMVFSSAIGGKEELEADVKMEELVDKLNFLKENLENEKHLILKTHEAMSKILTPKQEAMLVTRSYNKVVRSNATIQMVTNMYEVVLKENALAKCCAPGWEVL